MNFVLEGGGEFRDDLWRKYFQNGKRLYAPAYFTFWPYQKEKMTSPLEEKELEQDAQRNTEPVLSKEQVARLDATDNAVYQCLLTLLDCDEEAFPWNMDYIGEAEDMLIEFLRERGHRIYRPAIVTETDGAAHIEEYEEAYAQSEGTLTCSVERISGQESFCGQCVGSETDDTICFGGEGRNMKGGEQS